MAPTKPVDPLSPFHPLIRKWFMESFGLPTRIQTRAWPEIARGKHTLITAPTGSGKTLTAFLWALNQLITGTWPAGQTRVLYISPLKALNNDIRRNLLTPLAGLKSIFREAGEYFPDLGLMTRSGDTPESERRQMVRRPPELLITTPEGINILLSSHSGRSMLTGIATIILDEIHAVAGSKRGTHLITAVERLVLLSGEFQRIALSATLRPLSSVADFVGGFKRRGTESDPVYEKRRMAIVSTGERKKVQVKVCLAPKSPEDLADNSRWPALVESFRSLIEHHRSVLFFANSRRTAERITRLINEGREEELAYAHHGSLSREIRLAVEQRLKNGELKAIVATGSLELGIDIGDLDLVVLIQTPPLIASAIQRIGRSGHAVHEKSRGLIFPTHGQDLLAAAVMARGIADQNPEPLSPIINPLDVLAQVLTAMAGIEEWNADALFNFVRTSYAFHDLPRNQFDLVLEMLAGRYADSRLRELRPRLSIDRLDNTVRGRAGVLRLIYLSGGTIPDRGYYDLRLAETGGKIGELDEEFVWERRIGDTFPLGTQVWRIKKITHNDVEVLPAEALPGIIPFWRAEDRNRDFYFSEKILHFLEEVQDRPEDKSLKNDLCRKYFMEPEAAEALMEYLRAQRAATGKRLPHRHHLVIEHIRDPLSQNQRVVLHTLWGGRINRPLSLALEAAWEERYGEHLEILQNNDCLLLMHPPNFSARELVSLVTPENVERFLRQSLEKSGFFGARFRENAGRALLLPRSDFRRRLPLWLNRLRSKNLLERITKYPDFPILLETWRTCLRDEFDMVHLKELIEDLQEGRIQVSEAYTQSPSPFAGSLVWKQTNTHMYADDSSLAARPSQLTQEWLKEVLFSHQLRPRIPGDLVSALDARLQRTAPGYAPRSAEELLDWIKERVFIPWPEWQELLGAINRDHLLGEGEVLPGIFEKIVFLILPGASICMVCAVELLGRIAAAFQIPADALRSGEIIRPETFKGRTPSYIHKILDRHISTEESEEEKDLTEVFLQWLSFYGPVSTSFLRESLGLEGNLLDDSLASLAEAQEIVLDRLTENAEFPEICLRENLEILLRMARRARQPSFEPRPLEELPLFLAAFQGLTQKGNSAEDLQKVLDRLFGFTTGADAWEKTILPARLSPYHGFWLDDLMSAGPLVWFGCGKQKTSFMLMEDSPLFLEYDGIPPRPGEDIGSQADEVGGVFPREIGRYPFLDILRHSGKDSPTLTKTLWNLTWQGKVSNDAYATLRQGILNDFAPMPIAREERRPNRRAFNRWAATRPLGGNWYALNREDQARDPIEETELTKDRVRQLLSRYGIIFRELLALELPMLQWPRVFRALRLMELSGEILSGYFFSGLPGLQFVSQEAFRFLNQPLPDDAVYWLNAADPASLCGIKLDGLKDNLPARIASTTLVYHGKMLVLFARRNGRVLEFRVSPDNPRIMEYLEFFRVLLDREFSPEKYILVESINGASALESPYGEALIRFGFNRSYKGFEMVKKYNS